MSRMYDINCVTARHIEAFAGVPPELAEKITLYRKKRKRIRHIDELWRIRGMKRRYFDKLFQVFYVPGQAVPKIGERLPYVNTISTVTVPSKHNKRHVKRKKKKRVGNGRKTATNKDRRYLNGKYLSRKTCIASTKHQRIKEYKNIAKAIGKHGEKKMVEYPASDFSATNSTASSESYTPMNCEEISCNRKSSRITRWLSNLPNFHDKVQGVSRSPSIKSGWYSYYYKKSEKEASGKSKKKRSKVVFGERIPDDKKTNPLYTCTIL